MEVALTRVRHPSTRFTPLISSITMLKWLEKLKRHAAIASRNFEVIFKNVDRIPSLPAASLKLIREINQPEPDIRNLERVMNSCPGLATDILKMVNSSFFGLDTPVKTLQHAISLLGLRRMRDLALSHTAIHNIPEPVKGGLFDHDALWSDCLLKAMCAKRLAAQNLKSLQDEAFTAALISELAIPVLLSAWGEYYLPIFEKWRESGRRLSAIEREHLGWDHGQAAAWLLKSWGFPDEMVCYVGTHTFTMNQLEEHDLHSSVAACVVVASMLPSILRPTEIDPDLRTEIIRSPLFSEDDFTRLMKEIQEEYRDMRSLLDLPDRQVEIIPETLVKTMEAESSNE